MESLVQILMYVYVALSTIVLAVIIWRTVYRFLTRGHREYERIEESLQDLERQIRDLEMITRKINVD